MDPDLEIPVLQRTERQGVVIILGVRRVDRKGQHVAEVPAALQILVRNLVADLVGGVLHLLVEAVRKAELREDGVHLRVILPRHAEEIDDVPARDGFPAVPPVYDGGDLHAGYRMLLVRDGDGNVIGHGPGGHQDPGLAVPDDVEDPHERTAGPLQDRDDLPFRALAALFLGDDDTDLVLVKGSPALPGTDENRIWNALDADEEVSFPVHPGDALDFDPGNLLFRLFSQFAALSAAGFLSGHIVYRISTLGLT